MSSFKSMEGDVEQMALSVHVPSPHDSMTLLNSFDGP